MLQQPGSEKVLIPNEEGDFPLHSIVRQHRQDKVDLLVTLLTYSTVDVNSQGRGGMTALHYAVQVCAYCGFGEIFTHVQDFPVISNGCMSG